MLAGFRRSLVSSSHLQFKSSVPLSPAVFQWRREKHIMVAVDGSKCSYHAFGFALDNVAKTGDQFSLIAVHSPISYTLPDATLPPEQEKKINAEAEAKLQQLLESRKELIENRGYSVDKLLLHRGSVEANIVKAVTEHQVDLLVLGNRGQSAIKRMLIGSVCDACVHHAPCSVLVVK